MKHLTRDVEFLPYFQTNAFVNDNLKYKGIKFSKWFPKASPHFDYTRSISFFGNIALVLVWSSDNYFTLKVGVRVPFTGCKSIHVSKTSMKKDIYFERKFTLY